MYDLSAGVARSEIEEDHGERGKVIHHTLFTREGSLRIGYYSYHLCIKCCVLLYHFC